MRDITKEEEEKIKKLLGTESGLFSRAWAITNHTTQKKLTLSWKITVNLPADV